MMKKLILICFANVSLLTINAQTFVNNGATVAVKPGAVMIVKTDGVTTGSGSLENIASTTGALKNAGQVIIEGSFVNTSGVADGFGTGSGEYRVKGDWDNNATFTADQSTVTLYGPQQAIKGIQNGSPNPTTFYNLRDTLPGSVKTQEVDANVSNIFSIYTAQHATADYNLTILNPNPNAIVQDDLNAAYVSSTLNGRLVRYTNQKAEYFFPTGILESNPKIREVSIVPANATQRIYRVRYANNAFATNTTTVDGYDTAAKAGTVHLVNDVYYHLITSSDNDPADMSIFFDPTADNQWQSIGRWQVVPQWQDLLTCSVLADPRATPTSRLKMARPTWTPTSDSAHALVDTISVKTPFNFPTAFVADGQNTAPENTYFTIINQDNLVTLEELSVFDRWGEMVFDSKREGTQKWYGHFNGKLAAQGNYVFRAVVRNNSSGKQYPLVTGNVSLIW